MNAFTVIRLGMRKTQHLLIPIMSLFVFSVQVFPQKEIKTSLVNLMVESLQNEGVDIAIKKWHQLKNDTMSYFISESELVNAGNHLLRDERFNDATRLFDLCTGEFPQSYWAFYQAGRAYMTCGQFNIAIDRFKKSYELKDWFITKRFVYVLENYTKTVVDIPMRDGIKLKTIIYAPKTGDEKYPFLVVRSPYGIGPYEKNVLRSVLGPSLIFDTERFIFVYQDVRGKGMSEGDFVEVRPFIPVKGTSKDTDESTDAFDTFEWLLKNVPNNNSKIGLCGGSYHAFYSLMALLSKHPALAAVASEAPVTDWFTGDDFHRNGAFHLLQAVNFFKAYGAVRTGMTSGTTEDILNYPSPDLYSFFLEVGPLKNWNEKYFKDRLPFWNEMMVHGNYDKFWQDRNFLPYLEDINTPVLNIGGWYDAENLYGTLQSYKMIEKNTDNKNYLFMGPWIHTDWIVYGEERYSEILVNKVTAAKFYADSIIFPFYNFYLKDKGTLNFPEAMNYDVGLLQWHKFKKWPPVNAENRVFYLSGNNRLSDIENKASAVMYDEFISDPKKPVPHSYKIENKWDSHFMITDQRFAARRPDVLVYETTNLDENMTVVGDIEADLYVSTTGTDADWFVKVIDVYPENEKDYEGISNKTHMGEYQSLVRLGVMRGKFRNSLENPEPFIPGKVTQVKFTLNDICYTFKKGHKLMIQVQSSCFPLFDINPQKFIDIYSANEDDFQKAIHRVYRSANFQSNIKFNSIKQY